MDSLVVGSRRGNDGSWAFLDATGRAGVGRVHPRHVVTGHPHVSDVAGLPAGFAAWRRPGGDRSRAPVSPR